MPRKMDLNKALHGKAKSIRIQPCNVAADVTLGFQPLAPPPGLTG